ncbi:MAG TPA: hypothetical protein VGB48_01100 [Allosphingosinicella sp.]
MNINACNSENTGAAPLNTAEKQDAARSSPFAKALRPNCGRKVQGKAPTAAQTGDRSAKALYSGKRTGGADLRRRLPVKAGGSSIGVETR